MNGAGLNLLALLPCPVKVPLEQAFEDFLASLDPQHSAGLTYCLEGNANIESEYYDTVESITSLDELPDIVISPGFNSFFEPAFVSRFIDTRLFSSVNHYAGDRHLSRLGVCDPNGCYTMLAMNLLVPVVDLKRLGNRPVPKRWQDLLAPEYADSMAIRGHKDGTFCETLLMTIFKDAGPEGLQALGRNVRHGWHPSQMVKAAVGSNADSPAISVMPLFFAQNLKGRDDIEVIWPEDGALISPVTMLVKTDKTEALADLIAFLTGPQVSAIFADAFFPAVHPDVDNHLPDNASFKWIGWDYITGQDIKELIATANAAFRSGREQR
ncbi:ABC transporter substrate-binding protein [Geobacter sp. SVR]|uniref:ABC transporter substrate-binding protein n=1 Tax=Geobacter sp. SVR TaxID=2495594 RepID=UPI00143EFD0A|nr:ABC transporter substrate-binding protein [Geobacter sp. SVR]BCS54166.1 hypothetical protein GSVR_24740 [Geobacter sp. SVR]GCF85976.1 hypothetical protein GSbR_25760 [Geobacter sp. SVR]